MKGLTLFLALWLAASPNIYALVHNPVALRQWHGGAPSQAAIASNTVLSGPRFRHCKLLKPQKPALRLSANDGNTEGGLDGNVTKDAKEKAPWSGFPLPFVKNEGTRAKEERKGPDDASSSQPKPSQGVRESQAEGEAWKGFSFPPIYDEVRDQPKAVTPDEDTDAAKESDGVGSADGEAWKGFSFPKFEGSGEQYDIIEVLKAPAKQASESFPFPFGDKPPKDKESNAASDSSSAVVQAKEDNNSKGTTTKQKAEDGSDAEQAMKELLKNLDKARMDLADAAMRLSNFEQDIARVTLSREGSDTIIRIDTLALGEGKKRTKMLTMINSALASIPFPSKAKSDKRDAASETNNTQTKTAAAWEEEAELVQDILRKAKISVSDATVETKSQEEDPALEKKRLSKTRTLSGVAKVVRAWYGNPRDIMKLYNASARQMQDQEEAKRATASVGQEWNFWEALWKTDGDSIPGKDVTQTVAECFKVSAEDGTGSSVPVGKLSLKDSLNDIFGDPAFGVNKVLVVEFMDGEGNNMTAAWLETDSKPKIWKNELPQVVVSQIAGGALGSLQKLVQEEGLLDGMGDSGGNSWIKKMLWVPDDQLRDEVWVDEGVEAVTEAAQPKTDKPPPPVIPFIKYASPGPPTSSWTEPDCNLPEFRVLSLDGGGVRGVLSAVILGRIVEAVPSFLDNVDLIAGTSTGGLIALMLAAGYTPKECEAIYEYGCPLIFAKDPWRVYNPLKAKFSPKGREDLCRTYLGEDRTLRDLNKHVVVTAFKLDGKVGPMGTFISNNGGWRPSVFSNIPKMDGVIEPELDMYCWDAALRTSAAPTYFPAHRGYVDGAMFANNPSMLAVTKACAHFPRVSPDNMVVLSLGAGNFPISIDAENQDMDWGIKDWVPFIFDLMMDGDSLSGELLLRYMLNSPQGDFTPEHRYHRIDPTLTQYVELDDVDVIPELIRLGESVDLTDAIAFAQRHFSNTPSASDAFAQAAVRTATWAKEQATKVQLRDVIESLSVMPSNGIPNVGTWPGVFTPSGGNGTATSSTANGRPHTSVEARNDQGEKSR